MNTDFFKKLCCPFDKSDLTLETYVKDENGEIIEGMLTCSQCQRYYPIVYSIPIMTPDEYREKALEAPLLKKWGKMLDSKTEKMQLKESN